MSEYSDGMSDFVRIEIVMSVTFGGYFLLILLVLLHRVFAYVYRNVFLRMRHERMMPPPLKIHHPRDTGYVETDERHDDEECDDQEDGRQVHSWKKQMFSGCNDTFEQRECDDSKGTPPQCDGDDPEERNRHLHFQSLSFRDRMSTGLSHGFAGYLWHSFQLVITLLSCYRFLPLSLPPSSHYFVHNIPHDASYIHFLYEERTGRVSLFLIVFEIVLSFFIAVDFVVYLFIASVRKSCQICLVLICC